MHVRDCISELTEALKEFFGSRLLYVGLQGSHRRGEATENSDIDVMVVLDRLSPEDLQSYKNIISRMKNADKYCGFISGQRELAEWNRLEICQLTHETLDCHGTLKTLVPSYTDEDVKNYVKLSAGNLYHEICHRFIYSPSEKSIAKLSASYKQVFYILQNKYYLRTGEYVITKKELLTRLQGKDLEILETAMNINESYDTEKVEKAFLLLFDWCKETITNV